MSVYVIGEFFVTANVYSSRRLSSSFATIIKSGSLGLTQPIDSFPWSVLHSVDDTVASEI